LLAQKKLCEFLGADPQIAVDKARIMRLPGTRNLKYENKPLCKVIFEGETIHFKKTLLSVLDLKRKYPLLKKNLFNR
jgi:hypothetical protein